MLTDFQCNLLFQTNVFDLHQQIEFFVSSSPYNIDKKGFYHSLDAEISKSQAKGDNRSTELPNRGVRMVLFQLDTNNVDLEACRWGSHAKTAWRSCVVRVKYKEKELECMQCCVCVCVCVRALMDETWVEQGCWLFRVLVWCRTTVWGWGRWMEVKGGLKAG